MNREIKFRAWDGDAMSEPFGLDDSNTNWSNGVFDAGRTFESAE